MYTIKTTEYENIFRVVLHENCNSDIHDVCLELLPLIDEGKGAEYIIDNNTEARIAYY